MNVEFNPLEYMYLARVSAKLLKARKDLDAKAMAKGNNAIVKELANKFSVHQEAQPVHVVPLKRTHIRYLQEMLGKSLTVIDEKILPEYRSRPNAAELVEYTKRMEETREMIQTTLAKLEKAL